MPWFKVDDSFESHPKVKSIPRARRLKAIGLWTLAGSWAARQLTDGYVPSYMLGELAATRAEANTLIEVGLWSADGDGYRFNDWHDWQPTKAKVEADREAAKERMRVARERKKGPSSPEVRPNDSVSPPNGSSEVRSTPRSLTPTRPDPTRPDPSLEENELASASSGALAPRGVSSDLVIAEPQTAQTLVAEWIDHCDEKPPGKVVGHVARELKALLDEGRPPERVRQALATWNDRGVHPSVLPSIYHELGNAKPKLNGRQAETDGIFERAQARIAARGAGA